MPLWNMFSEEVAKERESVRNYGFDERNCGFKIIDRIRVNDSFKAQALRELAMRLELQEKLKEFNGERNKLVDQIESMGLKLFDKPELATILAALRHFQRCSVQSCDYPEHFADHPRLTDEQIDDLCLRLNG